MFCPRCAVQNLDDAKFCRACGTNLETVALALADKNHPAKGDGDRTADPFERWLETRKKSVNKIATGIGLVVSSILIGIALWLFSGDPDWIIIWMVLVGWMTCLGVISMLTGTAGLMESRFMRRQLRPASDPATGAIHSLPMSDRVLVNEGTTASMLHPQSSVTEHTTTRLVKPEPSSESPSNHTS